MTFIDAIASATGPASQIMWYIGFLVIVPLAIYFTLRYKALQVRKLPECVELCTDTSEEKGNRSLSSFEAFMMGLGERVGIGNIVSVAAAIMVGGPGAVFWMWVFAIIVAIVSFAETTVSQVYKSRKEDGVCVGGPAYNVSKGYGKEKLGRCVAVFYIIAMLIIAYAIGALFSDQFRLTDPTGNESLWACIGLVAVLAVVMLIGFKRLAKLNAVIVPIMALLWIGLCVAVMIANWNNLGNAFGMIFHYAFVIPDEITVNGFLSVEGLWEGIKGPVGGLLGTVIIVGLQRGVFSNDAGLGTVSIASSMADVKHPVQQGLLQGFGVFVDTIVLCTCTALVILSFGSFSDIWGLDLNFAPLVTEVMDRSLLGDSARFVVTAFMMVFVITTYVSFMNMLESTAYALSRKKAYAVAAKVALIVVVVISCLCSSAVAMAACDCIMAACAMINTTMIFGKRKVLRETYDDYARQKKAGIKRPEFHADALSDRTGVTEWK